LARIASTFVFSIFLTWLILAGCSAFGQWSREIGGDWSIGIGGSGCPSCANGRCAIPAAERAHPATCRVWLGNDSHPGSGVLIDCQNGIGLVVTAGHVGRQGPTSVEFPNGQKCPVRETLIDKLGWDTAVLVIDAPDVQPVELAETAPAQGEAVTWAGYGENRYARRDSRVSGYARPHDAAGYRPPAELTAFEELVITGTGRDGDSGGPIFDSSGRLAAIVTATNGQTVVGPCCRPIRAFLARVWQRLRGPPDPVEIAVQETPLPLPGPMPATEDDLNTERALVDVVVEVEPSVGDSGGVEPISSPPEYTTPTPEGQPEGSGVDMGEAVGQVAAAASWLVPILAGATGGTAPVALLAIGWLVKGWAARRRRKAFAGSAPIAADEAQASSMPSPSEIVAVPAGSFSLGWQEGAKTTTRNRFVRVDQTDLEGEAYREAIASWAGANPKMAGVLRAIEELAKHIHHGKRVAARMNPQADNPQIIPQAGVN